MLSSGVRVATALSEVIALKRVVVSLCLLVGLMPSWAARADFSRVDAPTVFGALASDTRIFGETPTSFGSSPSAYSFELGVDFSLSASLKTFDFISEPTRTDTMVIGAPPSSLSLFLSGLLSIGAWHACRSMGQWHPQGGWMPEWYHSGGPAQVGHAVPFDFHASMAVVCDFDAGIAGCDDVRVVVPPPKILDCRTADAFLLGDPVRGPPAQL